MMLLSDNNGIWLRGGVLVQRNTGIVGTQYGCNSKQRVYNVVRLLYRFVLSCGNPDVSALSKMWK